MSSAVMHRVPRVPLRRIPLSRTLSTSAPMGRQHLLWSGNLLGYTSDRLTALPRGWLDSLGVSHDVDQGLSWRHLVSSPTHTLLSYSLLARPDKPHDLHAPDSASSGSSASAQPHKVVSVGRNTHAQLGLGFASQEATRGMVTGALSGRHGVTALAAGAGTSFIVTHDEEAQSAVYAFGNHTLGQLGAGPGGDPRHSSDPYDVTPRSEAGDAQLELVPLPRAIDVTGTEGVVHDIAAGMDHAVLLRTTTDGQQQVLTTGLNTDGQLGVSPHISVPIDPLVARTFQPVPLPALEAGDRFVQVAAGADTSYVLSAAGRLYAWGNSEYGQALLSDGVCDRVERPVEVTQALERAYAAADADTDVGGARIVKVVAGGSWVGVLDSNGRVFTAGYGPVGLGTLQEGDQNPPVPVSTAHLARVSLPPMAQLYAGHDYAVAVSRSGQLYVWGLDKHARLGLGEGNTSDPRDAWRAGAGGGTASGPGAETEMEMRTYEPVPMPPVRIPDPPLGAGAQAESEGSDLNVRVLGVACGPETLFVLLEDGRGDVGRWNESYAIDSTDLVN